ncbi:hypothetical protein ACJMK2_018073 [Sinanodonta woodiana]|uniref:Sulfhydryl light chain n=1 Tax=Sinanodonta woodiana TaxID=1069815 RepID=A0ABD3UCB1_SINWO
MTSVQKVGGLLDFEDVREVFDLFDFWDGRDGLIDAFKVGDLLRCLDLNPTLDLIFKNGGTKKMGDKQYAFEDFLPIVESVLKTTDMGTFAEFKEAFKSFDREGQGYISGGELRYMLTALGEKISDEDCEEILKLTDTHEDMEGNIKYEDFIKKVMAGPPEAKK